MFALVVNRNQPQIAKFQPQFLQSQSTTIFSNHGSKFFYDNYYISKASIASKMAASTVCMKLSNQIIGAYFSINDVARGFPKTQAKFKK